MYVAFARPSQLRRVHSLSEGYMAYAIAQHIDLGCHRFDSERGIDQLLDAFISRHRG